MENIIKDNMKNNVKGNKNLAYTLVSIGSLSTCAIYQLIEGSRAVIAFTLKNPDIPISLFHHVIRFL